MAQPLWPFLTKLNIVLPYGLTIVLLVTYSTDFLFVCLFMDGYLVCGRCQHNIVKHLSSN